MDSEDTPHSRARRAAPQLLLRGGRGRRLSLLARLGRLLLGALLLTLAQRGAPSLLRPSPASEAGAAAVA